MSQKNDIQDHIDIAKILKALEDHIIHGTDMSATQVNAALTILKKAFPDKKGHDDQKDPVLWHEDALKQLK